MNLNDLSTQLLFTTLPIWTENADGGQGSATAFVYNVPVPGDAGRSIPLLVTNYHVVEKAKRGLVELVERRDMLPATDKRVRVELDEKSLRGMVDPALDLAVMALGPVLNELEARGRPAFFRSVTPDLIPQDAAVADLAAMEEVVFIGYPAGLRDDKNASPLIRRGITSTPVWNDYQGEPAFLIDAGVFPGSSGSPVFILNQGAYQIKDALVVGSRLIFLGVLTQTIIRSSATSEVYLGLGKVLKSSALRSFIDRAVRHLLPATS